MIGLGRMGRTWCGACDRRATNASFTTSIPKPWRRSSRKGRSGRSRSRNLPVSCNKPRAVWMMVPAAVVDPTLKTLVPFLDRDDAVIDGGNSYYHDDIRRAAELKPKGIHYVDAGTSGGVWGAERGYCLMIGGEKAIVRRLDPVFAALAPDIAEAPRTPGREGVGGTAEHGYLHCGASGAGHFVKMVHNGIEYGIMAAYAEGLNILRHANAGKEKRTVDAETTPLRHPEHYPYDLNLTDISEVWRRGSVIASWLLDLTATALLKSPDLGNFAGRVSDSARDAGRSRQLSTSSFRLPFSVPHYTNASAHAARLTLPTRCCPPCGMGLAATRKRPLPEGCAAWPRPTRTRWCCSV